MYRDRNSSNDEDGATIEMHDIESSHNILNDADGDDDDGGGGGGGNTSTPQRGDREFDNDTTQPSTNHRIKLFAAFLMLTLLVVLTLAIAFPIVTKNIGGAHSRDNNNSDNNDNNQPHVQCDRFTSHNCSIDLVHTFPLVADDASNQHNNQQHISTTSSWLALIRSASSSIDIAEMYFTLRRDDTQTTPPSASSTEPGDMVFNELISAASRGVTIRIVQNKGNGFGNNSDTRWLSEHGMAQLRDLEYDRLLGDGVLHTKLIIVDRQSFYVGSANADWRSLTHVKELGVTTWQCACLASDAQTLFELYWQLAQPSVLPKDVASIVRASRFALTHSRDAPGLIALDGVDAPSVPVFLSISPPMLLPPHASDDASSLVDGILAARQFIYISVMDYAPLYLYASSGSSTTANAQARYWNNIDNAIRVAAAQNPTIDIRFLASYWSHSHRESMVYLKSLAVLERVQVRIYVVEQLEQPPIPFTRFDRLETRTYVHTHSLSHSRSSSRTY
jgi:phospholipase D3/4